MTGSHKKLARAALGLPNERNQSYRNRFYAGFGSPDYKNWMAMCRQGYAMRGMFTRTKPRFFWLTLRGAIAAIDHTTETLDREDFPTAPVPK